MEQFHFNNDYLDYADDYYDAAGFDNDDPFGDVESPRDNSSESFDSDFEDDFETVVSSILCSFFTILCYEIIINDIYFFVGINRVSQRLIRLL